MRPLTRNEIVILIIKVMSGIVAMVVIALLMCRLRRGRSFQRLTIQQTPSAHGRADVIRICSVDCDGSLK